MSRRALCAAPNYEIAYSEPQTGKLCDHCKRLAKGKSVVQW